MGLSSPNQRKVPNSYECASFKTVLQEVFSIDVTADSESIHPTDFCHSCRGVLYGAERAKAQKKDYQHCRVKGFE